MVGLALQVPTMLILRQSATQHDLTSNTVSHDQGMAATAVDDKLSQVDKQQTKQQAGSATAKQLCMQFVSSLCLFAVCLLLFSDIQLRPYSDHFTTTIFNNTSAAHGKAHNSLPLGAPETMHWTQHVYGYMLTVRALCLRLSGCALGELAWTKRMRRGPASA